MKTDFESETDNSNELQEFVEKNIHKIRNCLDYYEEYYECNRIKGRFHQYFLYGKYLDCSSWKSDFQNCKTLEGNNDRDLDKLASIIRHEDERREQRLKDHLRNDVWPKRTEPPDNWNSELPQWIIENKPEKQLASEKSFCVIS